MAAPEKPPATLAELIRRRSSAGRPKEPPSPSATKPPVADRLGQFGLLFAEPEVEAVAEEDEPEALPEREDERVPERRLWSVAELVSALRFRVEREYADVWVEGEVSNCRPAPSGHLYFTLKDGDAQLPVVLFRREAALLKFKPTDGLSVLARGRVSVFESRGQLQLIANSLEPRGAGALQLAFEQLKAKLRAEGLFDEDRKRPLPPFPRTVGVITSTQGAVLRDIATVVRRRHARLNLLVFAATVQGPTCAPDVMRGLRYFNDAPEAHRVDVILIARGGGSAEDLSGFNDEALARAIASSDIPVVSAIGHETDFTIADFVADLRAPTPSAAAEIVTAAQHRIEERVQSLEARLFRAVRFQQMHARQRFLRVSAEGTFARLRDSINRRHQRVDSARFRLEALSQRLLQARAAQLRQVSERLQRQDVHRRVLLATAQQQHLQQRLERTAAGLVVHSRQRLERAGARLYALSPTAILERGYALVYREDGSLLRDASSTAEGETITARVAHGAVRAIVSGNTRNP
ncbi:exodeoxyribonuclease VII large subunit [Terriglobus roseus]|uniref:Exodeoxyribonuclease 7 large subunit n=1 Tax=Terriglobus roseus TaxID=392734 RepID=A0A1G7PFA7_9BACT|nr:exodeoxyribonuclease VII large subunit [Terriglobus roseus]SDF84160.1 Exodeoxyribonuclease VII large subunit [Terriglobus roseus]